MTHVMNPRQLMAALSLREFQRLCAGLDQHGPASVEIPVGGGKAVSTAGRLIERKFNVVRVVRGAAKIRAFVDLGHGVCHWTTFAADVEEQRAA